MFVLLVILTALPGVYEMLIPEQEDLPAEQAAIFQLSRIEAKRKNQYKNRKNASGKKHQLFNFDPNAVSLSDWQLLGLSPKQAAVMIRYRDKGGSFYKKEDLQKMYPISPQLYEKLEPYIDIHTKPFLAKQRKYVGYQVKPIQIELNSADTVGLDSVKGIGAAFARRIFNYRQRLGGFYKKEQLLEVFGMDSIKYREIKDQLSLEKGAIKKLNINRVVFDELRYHPYLNYKQVNAILQFRKQHGNYSNIADLKKVAILSAETLEKLAPYISFDHD